MHLGRRLVNKALAWGVPSAPHVHHAVVFDPDGIVHFWHSPHAVLLLRLLSFLVKAILQKPYKYFHVEAFGVIRWHAAQFRAELSVHSAVC